ncbi:hypothetical protein A2155_02220 [candidate division WWE3 bacterium RBG_16_52_45]|nr:MAG: hypothetical protein A2155_02220 [candidate division WWE3 bacterium RBG_16_52_45]
MGRWNREQSNAGWQGEKDVVNVWLVLFGLAVVMLVFSLREFSRLRKERDGLLERMRYARYSVIPLLESALYRSIRDWKKKHPREKKFVLGYGVGMLGLGSSRDADLFFRAFYHLKPIPAEERKFDAYVAKLGTKFGVYFIKL